MRKMNENPLNGFDCVTVGKSRFAQDLFNELRDNGYYFFKSINVEVFTEPDCIYFTFKGKRVVDFPFCQYQTWDHQYHVSCLDFGKLAEHVSNWITNTSAERKTNK